MATAALPPWTVCVAAVGTLRGAAPGRRRSGRHPLLDQHDEAAGRARPTLGRCAVATPSSALHRRSDADGVRRDSDFSCSSAGADEVTAPLYRAACQRGVALQSHAACRSAHSTRSCRAVASQHRYVGWWVRARRQYGRSFGRRCRRHAGGREWSRRGRPTPLSRSRHRRTQLARPGEAAFSPGSRREPLPTARSHRARQVRPRRRRQPGRLRHGT